MIISFFKFNLLLMIRFNIIFNLSKILSSLKNNFDIN